jgi:hypothetical protein
MLRYLDERKHNHLSTESKHVQRCGYISHFLREFFTILSRSFYLVEEHRSSSSLLALIRIGLIIRPTILKVQHPTQLKALNMVMQR